MHALAAVRHDIGSQDVTRGRGYLREFTQQFREYDSVLSPSELQQRVAAASTLLIGDYHALPACQRFAAELIEASARERRVVLGVEAVLARDQRILDEWWRREIAEHELRRRLRFDREWGYQWEPFYGLLCSARDHAEGLYGLDCMPREDLRRIKSRDQHAAAKIAEIRERHSNAAIFVLFGRIAYGVPASPAHNTEITSTGEAPNIAAKCRRTVLAGSRSAGRCGDHRRRCSLCFLTPVPSKSTKATACALDGWNAATDDLPDFGPTLRFTISSFRWLGH